MSSQKLPGEVWYEMRVGAHLKLDELADRQEWPADFYDDRFAEFLEAAVFAYHQAIERREHEADLDDFGTFQAPNFLLDTLADVSDEIHELERYRDRLIAFTRSFAADPESMRAIGNATGLSHTTIMRIADDDLIRSVAVSARKVAEDTLDRLTPQEDPDLYARLAKIAAETRKVTQE